MTHTGSFVSVAIVVATMLSGCANQSTRPIHPNFLDPEFSTEAVDRLVALPVVDLRKDRSVDLSPDDFVDLIHPPVFKWRGYSSVIFATRADAPVEISGDDLLAPKPEWIRSLGSASDRWIMIVTLDDLSSASTFGAAVAAACSGYLFDKSSAELVWQHRSSSQYGQGGLGGLAFKGTLEFWVARDCVTFLIQELPYKS